MMPPGAAGPYLFLQLSKLTTRSTALWSVVGCGPPGEEEQEGRPRKDEGGREHCDARQGSCSSVMSEETNLKALSLKHPAEPLFVGLRQPPKYSENKSDMKDNKRNLFQ